MRLAPALLWLAPASPIWFYATRVQPYSSLRTGYRLRFTARGILRARGLLFGLRCIASAGSGSFLRCFGRVYSPSSASRQRQHLWSASSVFCSGGVPLNTSTCLLIFNAAFVPCRSLRSVRIRADTAFLIAELCTPLFGLFSPEFGCGLLSATRGSQWQCAVTETRPSHLCATCQERLLGLSA